MRREREREVDGKGHYIMCFHQGRVFSPLYIVIGLFAHEGHFFSCLFFLFFCFFVFSAFFLRVYIPLLPVGGPHIQCDRRNSVDSLARRPTLVKYSQIRITHFVSSFLWAPPVATQFSVLSKNIHKVRAPPVATLLFHLISSPHFSGHRLWRLSFLLFGHRQWRPLSFHITASFLWALSVATQFSYLSYSELYVWAPSVATLLCHLSSKY